MTISQISSRIQGRYQRTVSDLLFRRIAEMRNDVPYISFSFDDFPRSAAHIGGAILRGAGVRATYYASFGLMGKHAETGVIFTPRDIRELLEQGNELGCHTFAHSHAWQTSPESFEDSIIRNKLALEEVAPGAAFTSFSYPISVPRARTKRIAGEYFYGCRCGGQTYNARRLDLNLLKAFFIEKSRNDLSAIKALIDENSRQRGCLIFATHDISESPTPYGCTPSTFKDILDYSLGSGARVLPVREALNVICGGKDYRDL